MDKKQLIQQYGDILLKYTDLNGMLLCDAQESFRLDDISDLVRGRDFYIARKEYMAAKILNHLLALLEIENQKVSYQHNPVILHLELTDFCNCRCIMCTHSYTKNDQSRFFDITTLEKYFPTCRLVVINGIGEPFAHPDIVKILSTFKEYQIKLSTTTNLTYLPKEILPLISDLFFRLSISCDGARAETFEKIRRNGKFSVFVENAKQVRRLCPNTVLHMAVTSMRQNLMESSKIVKLASEIGFDEVRFGRLQTNPFLENEGDSLNCVPNLAASVLQSAAKLGEELGITVNIPVIFRGEFDKEQAEAEKELLFSAPFFHDEDFYETLHQKYIALKQHHQFDEHRYTSKGVIRCEGICHWIALGCNINIYGHVRPCGEIIRDISDNDDPAIDIMNSPEQMELRKLFISGFLPDVCADCSYVLSNEYDWCKMNVEDYRKYYGIYQ